MTNNTKLLDGIVIFATVVDANGFRAAAKRLGHSTSFVSKTVADLEQRLGVRLLNRTTRSISLTDDGRAYYDRCQIILETAEEASALAEQQQTEPKGALRLTAPVSLGLSRLADMLPRFMERYPLVRLDIELNERKIDLVAEGFDLAIRVGQLEESSLISTKLAESRSIIAAAPDYWQKFGRPDHPRDLTQHRGIGYTNVPRPDQWRFALPDGITEIVTVPLAAQSNSAEIEAALAVAGKGVVRLPDFACKRELESGALETALEEYESEPMGIYAVYPHRAHLSAKVRALVDFLRQELGPNR